MTTETALTIPERAALALNSSKVTDELRSLVAASSDILAVIDGAGREQAHRIGMNLKNARIAIEKAGKAARDDATKFSKGVIAEEARLVAIIEPEEERVFNLRDKWDAKIEEEKQAKIAAERARIEAIQARIKQFSDIVLKAAGQGSAAIEGLQEQLAEIEITEVDFEEFIPQATEAKSASSSALEVAYEAAKSSEEATEAARIKREEEDQQRAAEAAENARVKAENDRVAAEQAKEAKRLADLAEVQRNELIRAQQEADEKIKAAAAVETARIQAEAAKRAKEHADAMKALADQRAEFEAQQQAVAKAKAEADHVAAKATADAEKFEHDFVDAAQMDAEFDRDKEAATKVVAIELQRIKEPSPTDEEIIAAYVDAFGGSMAQAIDRLRRFNT